jgi:hypothetical protein
LPLSILEFFGVEVIEDDIRLSREVSVTALFEDELAVTAFGEKLLFVFWVLLLLQVCSHLKLNDIN